ncbi:MAG: urate hydroxylase PuuD [Gemmatimonadota bacterium]|nr:MAG: urate hydroxylase PuuD [Gemmatimonadota bacterium]
MDPNTTAWLNLTFRWIHVIAGVAWIGTSFYFNWLNHHLRPPETAREGVSGELWSVHGGAFYRVEKFAVAPKRLPKTLHWFKWEAYLTWITGIALLILIYYVGADLYLVDPSVSDIGAGAAIAIGVGALVGAWIVYDLLCKSPLSARPIPFAVVVFVLATAVAFGLTRVFGSRGAYIHMGAILGTLMAVNVFMVIIPGQRIMVDAMMRGLEPDASKGRAGALRSLHNNYMTLPVLFIMTSSHYPMVYGNAANWAILAALALIGAMTRHYFNLRGEGRESPWILPTAAGAMIALAFVSRPSVAPSVSTASSAEHVSIDVVQAVIQEKCVVCHSANPSYPAYSAAPAGVIMDSKEQIGALAERINAVAVLSATMPLGNVTGLTQEERDVIGRWIREGAEIGAER